MKVAFVILFSASVLGFLGGSVLTIYSLVTGAFDPPLGIGVAAFGLAGTAVALRELRKHPRAGE